jgi:hypothetical protein
MRRFFNFGKPKYQAPQVAPIPEGQAEKHNGVFINEAGRSIKIEIFDHGKEGTLENALGTLEMAKDIVKQQIVGWHLKEQRAKGIIAVRGNGHG